MKLQFLAAAAIVSALCAAPSHAQASDAGGTVCGRVNAPSSLIATLSQQVTPENYIYARSASEEAKTTVHLDGTYCFTGLHTDLHIINAFDDGFPQYTASVVPVDGKTVELDM